MSRPQSKLYYLLNGDTVVSTGVSQQEGPGFKSTGYLFSLITLAFTHSPKTGSLG